MNKAKPDPVFLSAVAVFLGLLVVGLGLVVFSLISPYVYIFSAIMLGLCLGPVAEIRGI